MVHIATNVCDFGESPILSFECCAIFCTNFEHVMKQILKRLVIGAFTLCLLNIFSCHSNPNSAVKSDIVWIKNDYASLFSLGCSESDSFLILYSGNNNKTILGQFFWGKSQEISGYTKILTHKRIVSISSTHTSMIAELGKLQDLVGVESKSYISHPLLYNKSSLQPLIEVAPNGSILPETVFLCKPDLFIGYFVNGSDAALIDRIGRNKFPVLWCQHHLETHPLGRAEWIHALSWILGNPIKGQQIFKQVKSDYEKIREKTSHVKFRPAVASNIPYNGLWFVPQQEAYQKQIVYDAGGNLLVTPGQGTGTNILGIEQAIQIFSKADIWINTDLCSSRECILAMDQRISSIKAFNNHHLYHYNKKLNPNGSNPYWDMGCIYPNLILQDLFMIFQDTTFDVEKSHYYLPCSK